MRALPFSLSAVCVCIGRCRVAVHRWSRLRTLAKRTHRAEQQLRHMLFLDFLEGIVRIALMCPLPTSTDLDETGAV